MLSERVITVTLNPAIDVTYAVTDLVVGTTVRVRTATARSGGKGVNVAGVVRALGGDSLVLALGATTAPDEFAVGLARLGLDHRLIPGPVAVRRTVAVVGDDGRTTSLQEAGSPVGPEVAAEVLTALLEELERGAGAVVISGSVPPGLPPGLPAELAQSALARGVPTVIDVSGPALRAAAAVGAVLMPNRDELAELTGGATGSVADLVGAARRLLAEGAGAVVVTTGEDGAVAVTPAGVWTARPPEVVAGNPTGAGDAAAAALALRLAAAGPVELDWPLALADVVATSAACVRRPVAGEIDAEARAGWLDRVRVERLA